MIHVELSYPPNILDNGRTRLHQLTPLAKIVLKIKEIGQKSAGTILDQQLDVNDLLVHVQFLPIEIYDSVPITFGLDVTRHIQNVLGIDVRTLDLFDLDNVQVSGCLKVLHKIVNDDKEENRKNVQIHFFTEFSTVGSFV